MAGSWRNELCKNLLPARVFGVLITTWQYRTPRTGLTCWIRDCGVCVGKGRFPRSRYVSTLRPIRRAPPAYRLRPAEPTEMEVVLDDELLEFQRREKQQTDPGELQLVIDPEFL